MGAMRDLTIEMKLVPDDQTMQAIMLLLGIWQDSHPEKMVAMVPDHDRYKYEIIDRK